MQLHEIFTPGQIEAISQAARVRGFTDEQFITSVINEATQQAPEEQRRDGVLQGKPGQTLFKIESVYTKAAVNAAKRHLVEMPRSIASPREGHALLLEALEDVWLAVKQNQWIDARNKCMRLLAIGLRFMAEC